MIHSKFYKVLKFIGKKGITWFCINTLSGILLGLLELGFSLVLILLLRSLKITSQDIALPFGLRLTDFSPALFVVILVSLGISRALVQFLVTHSGLVANEMVGSRLRLVLIYETFKIKSGFLSLSEFQFKTGPIIGGATAFCAQIATVLPSAIQASILFVMMFERDWRGALIGTSGVAVAAVFVFFTNKAVKLLAHEMPNETNRYNQRIIRAIKNAFLLRALKTLNEEYQILVRGLLSTSSIAIRTAFVSSAGAALPQMGGVLIIALLIYVHLHFGRISGVDFLAFLYLFIRFVQVAATIAGNVGTLYTYLPQFKSATKYFFNFDQAQIRLALEKAGELSSTGSNWKRFLLRDLRRVEATHKTLTKRKPPAISFKHVSFGYENAQAAVIKNFDLEVEAGEQVAILGPSGVGKSTLLALTMGLIEPSSGEIFIDGQKPEDYFSQIESRVGYVGAEPFLIEGSIRENMLYGRNEQFTDADLHTALRDAHLLEWVLSLTSALDHFISENGEGLSAGQKQRLSLARALLSEPSFLVLDEVSANLDLVTESQVANTISQLKNRCTTLIVSHRPGLVKNIDHKVALTRS